MNLVLEGFNMTFFAYGMTGAGKTYTMFGENFQERNFIFEENSGLVYHIMRKLFENSEIIENSKTTYKLSFLEIYNEHIRDLLQPQNENLQLIEDPNKGVIVPDLYQTEVNNLDDLVKLIK